MPTLPPVTDTELRQLCQQGRKIEAIRRRHAASGSSLLEAKQYVDALEQGHSPSPDQPPGNPASLDEQVAAYCRRGAKLEAIKYYKKQTGSDLRTAKTYVEALEAKLQLQPAASQSTPLPPLAAPAPRRPGLKLLLGSAGLFALLTLAPGYLKPGIGGAGAYGFPKTFYRAGAGPSQRLDLPALLLDAGFALGIMLTLYFLGRLLRRRAGAAIS